MEELPFERVFLLHGGLCRVLGREGSIPKYYLLSVQT